MKTFSGLMQATRPILDDHPFRSNPGAGDDESGLPPSGLDWNPESVQEIADLLIMPNGQYKIDQLGGIEAFQERIPSRLRQTMPVEDFIGRPENQDFVRRQAFRERAIDRPLDSRFRHADLAADPLVMMNFIRSPVAAPHPDDGQFPEHGRKCIPTAGCIGHCEKTRRCFR